MIVVAGGKNKNLVVIFLNEYNSLKETMYLLSSEKNRKRPQESIDEMKKNEFSSHALIEK